MLFEKRTFKLELHYNYVIKLINESNDENYKFF